MADRKMTNSANQPQHCPACKGRGLLVATTPSCRIKAWRKPWIVVERCDACDRYLDDLEAALTLYSVVGWFTCENRGLHALADSGSKKR